MSSTLLEWTRAQHEEVERLERLIVKNLQKPPILSRRHRVRNMIDTIVEKTAKLTEVYEDEDGSLRDEVDALEVKTAKTIDFSVFYDRLREIREYYSSYPTARVVDFNEGHEVVLTKPAVNFTGEEAFGRYLDLHDMFNQYVNSTFGAQIKYLDYLDVFSEPQKIAQKSKLTGQYKEYMYNLLGYLTSFFRRTKPLQDLDSILLKVLTEFEEQWVDGKVEGWGKDVKENGHADMVIDLHCYGSIVELMDVGPQKLKMALAAVGLKTGGTTQQCAGRLFLTKDTPLEQLDKKHFAKGSCSSETNGHTAVAQKVEKSKEIALLEAKVRKLCDLLNKTIARTKKNVVKKQTLTYEDIKAQREEEETQADMEGDDWWDGQPIPSRQEETQADTESDDWWDGRPIPSERYMLQGLGQEFNCEICGNCSYWGRGAFEQHFQEWCHQYGMRFHGIPNTQNFNEITSIEEARERMQEERQSFRPKRSGRI